MLENIHDLTTTWHKTRGDVPAKLIGASTTVVGSKIYLFGGRIAKERRMSSNLYVFDMLTYIWEKIDVHHQDEVPQARYFHSADSWDNHLVIFGGMSTQLNSIVPDELCVLDDIRFFDLNTLRWVPAPKMASLTFTPKGRYSHLSSITADRLFIIGGQDLHGNWIHDVCVYDLPTETWAQRRDHSRPCGTYRSVAVSSEMCVRVPKEDMMNTAAMLGPPGTRFRELSKDDDNDYTDSKTLVHLSYSAPPSDEYPSNILLYSNYNFTDVKRELEVFSPLPDADFTIQDRSFTMLGPNLPPGLRFPSGALLGSHLIVAGTYLGHSTQSFAVWVLDLQAMTWSRLNLGSAIDKGSWCRGCLWNGYNPKFVIFGNRRGNMLDDYNRRLLSFEHVAVVELEAFGIYRPPPLLLDIPMQEFGLAALEEAILTDFEIVCNDGMKIACSRRLLEERWGWFKEQRLMFLDKAMVTTGDLPTSPAHVPLPASAAVTSATLAVHGERYRDGDAPGPDSDEDEDSIYGGYWEEPQLDPRLTPRSFYISESYPVTLALVQYFYTQALITPLQHAPVVLNQLLVLAQLYDLDHLGRLVRHAMHKALSGSTCYGVFEAATMTGGRNLQIRALKAVMAYLERQQARSVS